MRKETNKKKKQKKEAKEKKLKKNKVKEKREKKKQKKEKKKGKSIGWKNGLLEPEPTTSPSSESTYKQKPSFFF